MHIALGSPDHSPQYWSQPPVFYVQDGPSEGEGQRTLEQAVFTQGTVSPAYVTEIYLLV